MVGDRHGHFFVEELADDDSAFGGDFGVEAIGQLVRIVCLAVGEREREPQAEEKGDEGRRRFHSGRA